MEETSTHLHLNYELEPLASPLLSNIVLEGFTRLLKQEIEELEMTKEVQLSLLVGVIIPNLKTPPENS